MDISDEDADEILTALSLRGFGMPYRIRVFTDDADSEAEIVKARRGNRQAVKEALESTEVWDRYRIY